jgi:hypothetical protein
MNLNSRSDKLLLGKLSLNRNINFKEEWYKPHWHLKRSFLKFHIVHFNVTVPGSITGGVTGEFFRGSFRQNHVPWSRLSLWKWVPGISPGVKAAGAYGWRPTTLVVPNVEMIRGLNLPGTPRATSACRGTPLLYLHFNVPSLHLGLPKRQIWRLENWKVVYVSFI